MTSSVAQLLVLHGQKTKHASAPQETKLVVSQAAIRSFMVITVMSSMSLKCQTLWRVIFTNQDYFRNSEMCCSTA